MSQGPRRHLRLETIDGVTVVSFVDSKIVQEENIQEVGDQLYALVEDGAPHALAELRQRAVSLQRRAGQADQPEEEGGRGEGQAQALLHPSRPCWKSSASPGSIRSSRSTPRNRPRSISSDRANAFPFAAVDRIEALRSASGSGISAPHRESARRIRRAHGRTVRDTHDGPVSRVQGARSGCVAVVPDGRLLRDVRRRCRTWLGAARTGADLARQGDQRGADGRVSPSGTRSLSRQARGRRSARRSASKSKTRSSPRAW